MRVSYKVFKTGIGFWKFFIFNYLYKMVDRTFVLDDEVFSYFYHTHGSWANERCVEVAVGLNFLKRYNPVDVLEVGNVIGMYQGVKHDVLDLYDTSIGVINEDVVSFDNSKKYKLIFSLSTLEHVGFDETPSKMLCSPDKPVKAVCNLKHLLTDDGLLLVTMPLGYRVGLDDQIFGNVFGFDDCFFMRRISWSNRWVEIPQGDAVGICFDDPFPKANGLFIGRYVKKL